MDDVVHPLHRLCQARAVANVADEITHHRRVEFLLHLELLEFVARKDNDFFRLVIGEQASDKLLAERAGAAGNEYGFSVEHKASACHFQRQNVTVRAGRKGLISPKSGVGDTCDRRGAFLLALRADYTVTVMVTSS